MVKIINKNKFTREALNENSETFVMHVAALEVPAAMLIYLSKATQKAALQ